VEILIPHVVCGFHSLHDTEITDSVAVFLVCSVSVNVCLSVRADKERTQQAVASDTSHVHSTQQYTGLWQTEGKSKAILTLN